MEFFKQLFAINFMPHGFCYLWDPRVVWLHVISDALITLSYYCIPVILIYFIRKNKDLPLNRIFWMFGTFILACGTTHLMEVWNVWHGNYLLAGVVKAITAVVSVITAAMLVPLVPKVMSLPERMYLQKLNHELEREIADQKRFDTAIDSPLRRKVMAGFVIALTLTVFIGYSTWQSAQRAGHDAYWASHTHEVMETVQQASRHIIEAETSARAFALTGREPLLVHYLAARDSIRLDETTLRALTQDNISQQRRLDVLEAQVEAGLKFSDSIIAQRREAPVYSGGDEVLETERRIEVARATTQDMYSEEARLLIERTQKGGSGQHLTKIVAILGALFAIPLWVLAKLTVDREISVSERARAELNALNAELEQRVEQRTAALRESEERFLAMANGIRQLAWMAQADGSIFWFNERWYEYTGKTYDQMQGCGWESVLEPDELPRVREKWKGAIANAAPLEMEFRLRGTDGIFHTFLTQITPVKDAAGKVSRWFGTNTDISERKKAEEVLQEQSRVLDLAQVMVRDMGGRIVLWTLGAEKLYGFTREQAVGSISHELFHTEFPAPLEQIDDRLLRTNRWDGELVHRKRDGSRIVVSSQWMLHRDANGQPARVLEANTDITARKDAEERLVRQTAELSEQAAKLLESRTALEIQSVTFRSVLDSMVEGLVATDEAGKFVLWNPAAERILGMVATNLDTMEWTGYYGLYMPDTITPFPSDQIPLVRAIRGESSTTEMFVRNPEVADGSWIEVCAGPLKDKMGVITGGIAAFRDVTQRRNDEREIRKLNDELEIRVMERTAQLETVNQELESFSYSVSHDLRAPLRHIMGFGKMLVEEFGESLDPVAKHYLDRIQAGTQKMGLLVDELLSLARVGRLAIVRQPTKLNAVVDDVIAILESDIGNREVRWVIGDLATADCDPVLVKQIFQNLIANALKFTRGRVPSVITIAYQKSPEDGPPVFMVRDNGIGFNMKYVDKLFGVFQRLHRPEDFEGSGIGLATVQRIVQKHGGRIWAEAGVEKGAAFYFTLSAGTEVESKSTELKSTEARSNGATAGGQS
jgi:PAS domain S-box-containing protein